MVWCVAMAGCAQSRFSLLIVIMMVAVNGCFGGIEQAGSVLNYQEDIVKTQGGAFRIGRVVPPWKRHRVNYRALVFENPLDGATLTIDSWCKGAFDDAPIAILADQLTKGLVDFKVTTQRTVILGGREALRTSATGMMDGRRVFLCFYVLKMNNCVFDFVYVALKENLESLAQFDDIVQGFEYLRGPRIL